MPADGLETANAVRAAVQRPGPVYIRLGRGFEPPHYENEDYGFEIGKAVTIDDGTDITVISCGVAVYHAAEAAKLLKDQDGICVRVLNMHTIKPIDEEAIMEAVTDTRRILAVEEHNVIGGLGSAVADVIAESGKGCAFAKSGLPDCYSEVGYPEDLYSHYCIDADGIVAQVRGLLQRVRGRRRLGGRGLMGAGSAAAAAPRRRRLPPPAPPHLPQARTASSFARACSCAPHCPCVKVHARGRPGHGQALRRRHATRPVRRQERPTLSAPTSCSSTARSAWSRASGTPAAAPRAPTSPSPSPRWQKLNDFFAGKTVLPGIKGFHRPGLLAKVRAAAAGAQADAAEREPEGPGQAAPQGQAHGVHDHRPP